MMTWNSPLSIGLDFFLGFLPALPLLFVSLMGCIIAGQEFPTFFLPANQQPRDSLGLNTFVTALGGAFACISLIVVTVWRTRTKAKWLFILGLSIGVFIAARVFVQPLIVSLVQRTEVGFSPFILLAVPISAIAVKHIVMLTRANP
jgi:hypothetical protein